MPTLSERFWSKVDVRGPDACWEWTACRHKHGYGKFGIGDRVDYAHRVSFLLSHGRQPQGLVRHTCDNPPCVNPAHLLEGTYADNVADMMSRGRARHGRLPGETNPMAKLTERAVREMRAASLGGQRNAELVRQYGVSKQLVSAIVNYKSWRHVV